MILLLPNQGGISAMLLATGVTLADIERETAPRVGPYRQVRASSGTTSTFVAPVLRSTIELGGVTDQYVLRRGALLDGTAITSFPDADRVRLVKQYVPSTGTVTVDDVYTAVPVNNELIEFHHLHPQEELRAAVRAGLKRCYMVDRSAVTLSTASLERNLSSSASWITDPQQVYGIASFTAGTESTLLPLPQSWHRAFGKDGRAWLAASPDPYPATLLVTSRRPHYSYVNGTTSTAGPLLDDDVLAVDLHYAASAAHVEAWRIAQDKLQDASAERRRLTLPEAAAVFTAAAYQHFQPPKASWGFSEPFGGGGLSRRTSLW